MFVNYFSSGKEGSLSGANTTDETMKMDSTVVNGVTFLVTDEEGRTTSGHDGFYHRDTRYLDRYRLRSARGLDVLEVVDVRPGERLLHLGAPLDRGARALHVTRRQVVTDGLYERVSVSNLTNEPREAELVLDVAGGFQDLFEVRGHEVLRDRDVAVAESGDGVSLSYDPDDVDFSAAVTVTAPDASAIEVGDEDGRASASLAFDLRLDANETSTLPVAVEPAGATGLSEAGSVAGAFDDAIRTIREHSDEWLAATDLPDASSDNDWRSVLAEARENLLELRLDTEHGPMYAAGVPWFATAFGRDSLIAALQAIDLRPELGAGTVRYLAANQATERDEFRDAEPGKILHEIRHGETVVRGLKPHGPYFGTVDATALFVVLLHEVWRTTGDDALVEELWENAERALAWLDDYGDRDGDGFVEYGTGSDELRHQAWKDSGDGIVHPDGSHPDGPLAVAEVQGYAYDAKRRAAELAAEVVGDRDRAAELAREAADLEDRFDEAFWLPDEQFYAVALDGDGEPVPSVTTNPGHCLWSGIVPESRAGEVVDRLLAEDMFTGWGIRTLSADHETYNPQSYHLGSVWPHDNSLCALGMARYGYEDAARRVAEGLVDAAVARGNHRLPELFAGFDREETEVPVTYGEACEPQAWAAGAPFACLRAIEGEQLTVDAPSDVLRP